MTMKRIRQHSLIFILAASTLLASCHIGRTEVGPTGDTVAASEFAPLQGDTLLPIDLKTITGIVFPRYKIKTEETITADSISLSMDEETPASGNYRATLLLDTFPGRDFCILLDNAVRKDTCWESSSTTYSYTRKDRQGGLYQMSILKSSRIITLSHINADMLPKMRPSTKAKKREKLK